jgi:hypothetical protein
MLATIIELFNQNAILGVFSALIAGWMIGVFVRKY